VTFELLLLFDYRSVHSISSRGSSTSSSSSTSGTTSTTGMSIPGSALGSLFDDMTPDLIESVLLMLDHASLCRLERCSPGWRDIMHGEAGRRTWKDVHARSFGSLGAEFALSLAALPPSAELKRCFRRCLQLRTLRAVRWRRAASRSERWRPAATDGAGPQESLELNAIAAEAAAEAAIATMWRSPPGADGDDDGEEEAAAMAEEEEEEGEREELSGMERLEQDTFAAKDEGEEDEDEGEEGQEAQGAAMAIERMAARCGCCCSRCCCCSHCCSHCCLHCYSC